MEIWSSCGPRATTQTLVSRCASPSLCKHASRVNPNPHTNSNTLSSPQAWVASEGRRVWSSLFANPNVSLSSPPPPPPPPSRVHMRYINLHVDTRIANCARSAAPVAVPNVRKPGCLIQGQPGGFRRSDAPKC